MNPHEQAVAFIIKRLRQATSLQDLERQWHNLGRDMQTDEAVQAEKNALKGKLK